MTGQSSDTPVPGAQSLPQLPAAPATHLLAPGEPWTPPLAPHMAPLGLDVWPQPQLTQAAPAGPPPTETQPWAPGPAAGVQLRFSGVDRSSESLAVGPVCVAD